MWGTKKKSSAKSTPNNQLMSLLTYINGRAILLNKKRTDVLICGRVGIERGACRCSGFHGKTSNTFPAGCFVITLKKSLKRSIIGVLNRIYARKDYECFSEAAKRLGVSKTALAIRSSQLGLVGRNDLYDPYALVDIFPEKNEIA